MNWINSKFTLHKKCPKINLLNVAGTKYEGIWELSKDRRSLIPVDLTNDELFDLWSSSDPDTIDTSDPNQSTSSQESSSSNDVHRDNRNLLDDGTSQKLTRDEIEILKSSETSSEGIINQLVENSATFHEKTKFSQHKYIMKKRLKYSNYYVIRKPTIRLLAEMFYSASPAKQHQMRPDMLSQIMSSANISYGGKYMVVDNNTGLLTAALLDRMVAENGSKTDLKVQNLDPGVVIQVLLEPGPVDMWRSCVDALNLPQDVVSNVLLSLQIKQLSDLLSGHQEETTGNNNHEKQVKSPGDNNDMDDPEREAKRRKYDERNQRKMDRKAEEKRARLLCSDRSLNGLIIFVRNTDPKGIINLMIEFLESSAPFVIYCQNIEPLSDCLLDLKSKGSAVNLRIHESFNRKYQVLSGRTRPEMIMSGSSGYLLTGIKVIKEWIHCQLYACF